MYLPSNSTILLFKTTFIVITNPADILTISGSCSIFEFALFFWSVHWYEIPQNFRYLMCKKMKLKLLLINTI